MVDRIETFDDMNMSELDHGYDLKPFQHRDDTDDEGTLQWLNENFDFHEEFKFSRMEMYRRLHALYKGRNYRSTVSGDYVKRLPKMSVNIVYEMIEAKVSQTSKIRTNVSLIPNNNEPDDVNNSKACKKLLDNRSEDIDLEGKMISADRICFKYGDVFIFVLWDKDAGPCDPSYENLKKMLPDKKELKKVLKQNKIQNIKLGDVVLKVMSPDRVFPEFGKNCWEDIDYIEFFEFEHIDHVKACYPDKSDEIRENARSEYQHELTDYNRRDEWIMVRHFFHRKTKFLPEGEYIKYVDDCILERGPYPYNEECLPCVRDTDIEIDGEFWGRSFVTQIEQLQRFSNNLWSATARDYSLASAPKWVMPKGAVRHSQLTNDLGSLEYVGPTAPQLVTYAPTNNQVFDLQDRIDGKVSKISMVYDISRGEPPKGVTANSALRFLDEQEQQVIFPIIKKRNRRVVDIYRMMIRRMAEFYTADDGRTVRLLGEDNTYLIESFKKADFNNIYDVKIMNSPSLPDTKAGKISAIIDLNMATQTDPIFRKEEIIQMLDLALDDSFKDEATVARTSAKTILDGILNGEPTVPPKPYDNLLVHYGIFMRAAQEDSFKKRDPMVQATLEQRLTIIEGFMWERAQKNPMFAQKLMMIESFPSFFTPPEQQPAPQPGSIGVPRPDQTDTGKIKNIPKQEGVNDGTTGSNQ